MASLGKEKKQYETFEEICGAHMDTSFDQNLKFLYVNDTSSVSLGGLTDISPGS